MSESTSAMTLIPLGVGNAFSAKHYTTSFALGVGGDWILIDCPHPIRKMLHEGSAKAGLPLDLDRIQGVVLSHLHADHCSGLEDYSFYSFYMLKRKARIAAQPDVMAKLWSGVLSGGMSEVCSLPGVPGATRKLDDFFEVTPLDLARPVRFGPFSIECRFTIHSVPTTAFRIEAAGRTLGFSADTAFDAGLIDWLEPADLIIHEVTRHPEAATVHTHFDSLKHLPARLRAKMRLTHYSDDFDHQVCDIEPLAEGKIYAV